MSRLQTFLTTALLALSIFSLNARSEDFTLDVDADGKTEPLTDGLLIIRHLFDFEGETLTSSAVGSDATRSNPQQIKDYLNTYSTQLDIDGDGLLDELMSMAPAAA